LPQRPQPVWDNELLDELARALRVDRKTIQENVRMLLHGLGPVIADAAAPPPRGAERPEPAES
jgi:hypothetical protein